ncbi:helix-turn-helix domain-containing protein [Kordia algicida OT-1]|uniref:HTH araC/xylS-type domain-containing protein n=1 Tax=Kordia algicida OT-1 TaxID=391587 RepID=A9E3C6_9FLAO|nr:helix-turn-helix domain-containing protein [Kordia algicida]EDP95493.1 hypothetical protein KAOT1_11236 [Kordia algicida OT-1]
MLLQKYIAVLLLIFSISITEQSLAQENTQDTIQQFDKDEFRASLEMMKAKKFAGLFSQQYKKDSLKSTFGLKHIEENMIVSKDLETQFWGYYCLAKWENYKTNFQKSISYIKRATEVAKKEGNPDLLLNTYIFEGNFYYDYSKYKESMESYLKALEYAKKTKSRKRQLAISQSIALLKIEVGDNKGAIELLEGTLRILEEEYQNKFTSLHVSLHIALTKSCMRAEEYEKAISYGKKGVELSNEYGDEDAKAYLYNFLGEINIAKGDYAKADELLQNAWEQAHKIKSAKSQLPFINLNRAKLYYYKKEYFVTIDILQKIESNQKKKKTNFFSLEDMYKFLGKSYKAIGNTKKSLFYFEKTNEVYTENDKKQNAIGIEIIKKYDLKSLKEELSQAEEKTQKTQEILAVSIFLALLIIGGLIYFYKKREKENQRKFTAILKSLEEEKEILEAAKVQEALFAKQEKEKLKENTTTRITSKKEPTTTTEVKELEIIDETKERLLKKLKNFEAKELFLSKNSSLNEVAKKLKTNTSYLSKLVNSHKGKSFTAYITDLRVNYAIRRLKEDKKFRSYTIDSIAREIGFNRSESFSRAFKNKTGLYPSYYIKNLDSQNVE